MSLNKSATRRLSLLAGAAIVLSAFAGVSLAPAAALAADECGDPSANGAAADILTCVSPPTRTTGLDYSTTTNGNLTLILQNRLDTGTAGTGGVRMFGKTGESMTLIREDNPLGAGDPRIINTAGRAIDVTTLGVGNVLINLTDGDPTSEASVNVNTGTAPIRITGSTDAIRAEAQGTGAVSVVFAETGVVNGTSNPRAVITAGATAASNGSGILARSTSGAINIDSRGATFTINGTSGGAAIDAAATGGNVTIQAGPATGRLYGVRAATSGAGVIAVTLASGASASGSTGLAGADLTAGTGATTLTLAAGTLSGGSGAAIRATSANTSATAAVNVQNTGGTVSGRVDFSAVTAGGVTFNNAVTGRWTASGASVFSGFNDTLTMAGSGTNTTAAGASLAFGAGNDSWSVATLLAATTTSADFGTGTDTFAMSGVLAMDGLTLTNLEAFNHSGVIYMGGTGGAASDGVGNDVLRMTGGTFTGSGSARVVMDVLPGLGTQVGCAAPTGAGDCLDLRGASTAGVTVLTLNDVTPDAATLGVYNPEGVTLVDVGGAGTSAAGHFVLDPDSTGYVSDRTLGGVVSRPGLFVYALRYDATNQRHVLTGLPRSETLEYAVLGGAALSIWQMTAEAVTDRQTDLRAGTAGAVWVRAAGDYVRRNASTTYDSLGQTLAVDTGYQLYAGSVIGGMDLIAGHRGDYDYVVGGQLGYVGSSFDLDQSTTSGRFSGGTGGAYASAWSQAVFLDATVNANMLTLDYNAPGLGSKTNTYLNSLGAQAEGGVHVMLGERTFLEPLVTLSYVRTRFEEISLDGGEIKPADAKSVRAAFGLRLGAALAGQAVNVNWFLTGRAWNEFDGQTGGMVRNPGADLPFADELSGGFGEAEAGLNLVNGAGTLSGFLATGVKFKKDYDAVNLSAGVRLAW